MSGLPSIRLNYCVLPGVGVIVVKKRANNNIGPHIILNPNPIDLAREVIEMFYCAEGPGIIAGSEGDLVRIISS